MIESWTTITVLNQRTELANIIYFVSVPLATDWVTHEFTL